MLKTEERMIRMRRISSEVRGSSQAGVGNHARCRTRAAVLVVLTLLAVVFVLSTAPRDDSPSYFAFADQRTLLGVPRFMDVISGAPWALLGIAGLFVAWRGRVGPGSSFTEAWERRGSMVLFAAILGISIGSAYFHHSPGSGTLVWDRLPMAISFMSFLALMIGDRISLRCGRVLFWPLLAFAAFSVWYWRYTEVLGRGDFRLYILVQFIPLLAVPLMLVFFPARYTRAGGIWLSLCMYGVAKLLELCDAPVFALTGIISGHTLKHLASVVATLSLLRVIQLRRQVHHPKR